MFRIWLSFNDGMEGEINLEQKIKSKNGVFEPLKELDYFKNFEVKNDTISWENGADFAPESLYNLLLKNQKASK